MDAAVGIRRLVASAEQTQCAISILSLDFRTAFVRLTWLFVSYSRWKRFWWYPGGNPVGPIQECYLQMWREWVPIGAFSDWMFGTTAMPVKHDHVCYSTQRIVDSLVETLERLQITPTSSKVSVFAFRVTSQSFWRRSSKKCTMPYQRAVGASLNLPKWKALPLGRWNSVHGISPLDIPYVSAAKSLGVKFHAIIAETTHDRVLHCNTHTRLNALVRLRDLKLLQCVR